MVIHQHFLRHTAKVFQAADDALIRVLRIFTVRAPEVEPSRVAQLVHDKMDFTPDTIDLGVQLPPVTLQLLAWLGLEAHRGSFTAAHHSLRLDVVQQNTVSALIPLRLDLPQDHLRIPNIF